ncbi:MAG: chain-length determining protein [Bacteroides sp.]|nr:chain-length determining protein [Bacteroides sp.]MCM1447906.1 chain-length determining protein [Bacteroides sp.]
MTEKQGKTVPVKATIQKLVDKKWLFMKVWIATFILSATYILPQPRTYTASTLLAPEMGAGDNAGGLSALASSFGFNIGGGSSVDAIYPTLYPELISSNDFIVGLFDIQVETLDGSVRTDLYTYLTKHQKSAIYKKPVFWVKRKLKAMFSDPIPQGNGSTVNPSRLTEQQFNVVEILKANIICNVDPLTSVISLRVNSQDPLVAASLADSVCARLQDFITSYRTSKAKIDVEHYTALVQSSYGDYKKAMDKYATFCDRHKNISMQATNSERDRLETELAMALSKYQAMSTQAENAKTKLQENTPAFTTLQNASVPLRPSAPKRVFFCLAMLMLATLITTARILKDELYSTISFFGSTKA